MGAHVETKIARLHDLDLAALRVEWRRIDVSAAHQAAFCLRATQPPERVWEGAGAWRA